MTHRPQHLKLVLHRAGEPAIQIPLPGLPATCVVHLDSENILCGGWDGVLHVLQKRGSAWVACSVDGKTLQGAPRIIQVLCMMSCARLLCKLSDAVHCADCMMHAEPAGGGFSERMLSMLPWNQTKEQGGSCGEALQQGASIQQIAIMRREQQGSEQPGAVFSVMDRYSTLQVWQWSLDGADVDSMGR